MHKSACCLTHNIFSAFDANPSLEVRAVFLDFFKASDGVWHDGLLYKLKSNGIDGNFFNLIKSFLHNKCQQVIPNGESSIYKSVTDIVLHSLVLVLLFLLITLMLATNLQMIFPFSQL